MTRVDFSLAVAVLGLLMDAALAAPPATLPPDHPERAKAGLKLFQSDVRALLVAHCLDCHGGKSVKGDFDLATREKLMDSGFVAASADDSYLIELIEHRADPGMPFKLPKLPDESIALIRKWVDLGAPYDQPLVEGLAAGERPEMVVEAEDREFWSFRPLADHTPPKFADDRWSRTPVDRFIAAQHRAAGLTPNPAAERRVLIRRAYFDLLGLPPTPAEVAEFVSDPDPHAWDKLLDRLLESEHYGERQARHWMDVARFAESHGYEQDYNRPHAYHYRDFLIKAFNADLPFDQFTRWQLAGDELAPDDPLALMATGFLGAGSFPTQLTENEFESARYDELDDMVATTGVAFLGLSIGCARCHDHKFDPIPTRDYYRLAAAFATTIRSEIELDLDPAGNQSRREQFARRKAELAAALTRYEQETLEAEFDRWIAGYDPETRTVAVTTQAGIEGSAGNAVSGERKAIGGWTLLDGNVSAGAKTDYKWQADGSWLASGKAPNKETLTIEMPAPRGTWRGLRLEALAHDSLPQRGPGRAANGNFALGDVRVERAAAASPQTWDRLALQAARATHQQDEGSLSVAASIDADPVTGWAVDGGGIGRDQAAVFDFAAPLAVESSETLRVTLQFQHANSQHVLGRFRLSLTETESAAPVVGQLGPEPEVLAALKMLQSSPTVDTDAAAEPRKLALQWFRTTLPEWQRLQSELTKHAHAGDGVQLTKVMVTSEGYPHIPHHADGRGFPHFYPDVHRLNRGDVHQKQEVSPPGYLQVLMQPGRTPEDWQRPPPAGWTRTSFRRSALADWITDVESGAGRLLARVIVNRLWQQHFGQGLVATPNDFGFSGDRPTHPELLDWLAGDLIANGWQLKRLHKLLMTSSVYLQNGDFDEARAAVDRENRLWWRRPPRRLEAEPIRDAMLAVSGRLDPRMYGPGTLDENMTRRSIYFFIKRSELIPTMMLFDWPEHLVSIGRRATTTVAPQALSFLNSPQGRRYAVAFAARLAERADADAEAVTHAYQLALTRDPTPAESQLAQQFLEQQRELHETAGRTDAAAAARIDFCQALFGMNEFLYVE